MLGTAMTYKNEIYNNYFLGEASDYVKVHRGNQESYSDNISDILPTDKNAKILEIGCGAGQILAYLKSVGYKHIEGADIGEEQTAIIRKMDIAVSVISSISEHLSAKKLAY